LQMKENENERYGRSPELRDYVAVLRNRKWSILSVTALVVISALAFSYQQIPLYQSETEILIKDSSISTSEGFTGQLVNLETERKLAESEAVARLVADRVKTPPDRLLEGLSVEVAPSTEIMIMRYVSPRPVQAQRGAEAFAEAYLEYRRKQVLDDMLSAASPVQGKLQQFNRQLNAVNEQIKTTIDRTDKSTLRARRDSLVGQIGVLQQELANLTPPDRIRVGQIVGPADLPTTPVTPNHLNNAALAAAAGLMLGMIVGLIRERLDDRLRGRDDLEHAADAQVLAVVPRVPGWRKRAVPKVVALEEPRSAAAEAYRSLRTAVLFAAAQRSARVLMIASPHAGEGKTVTVANLGVTLAQAGKKVIVISADLRKPRLHNFFGLGNQRGLTDVLANDLSPWDAVQDTALGNLKIMASGPVPSNPAELLGSDSMGELLKVPSDTADYILLDTAPVLAVADAATLAPLADVVLFVADSEHTHRGAVEQARRQLDQVNANVIGSILNNFDPSTSGAAYYPYYRYTYRWEEPQAVGASDMKQTGMLRLRPAPRRGKHSMAAQESALQPEGNGSRLDQGSRNR
jgi:polysaccharide biosynthesis transport protein